MSALLEARGLCVARGDRTLIRQLDLVVGPNERLAILGKNGAGKSTLLLTLAGLRAPAAGAVLLAGKPYAAHTPREAALLRGLLPQQHADAFRASVLETALIGRHPHLSRWASESADDTAIALTALAALGLENFADRRADTLSGGERQRLAIATLFTQSPQLMLADEPLAHLDPGMQSTVLDLFDQQAGWGGVIAVLHDPTLAARHYSRALMLFDGGDWLLGAVDEVITAANLERLHHHPFRELRDGARRIFVAA